MNTLFYGVNQVTGNILDLNTTRQISNNSVKIIDFGKHQKSIFIKTCQKGTADSRVNTSSVTGCMNDINEA